MSEFTTKVVDLLNKFTKTMPGLVLPGTSPASNIQLGDMISLGASKVCVVATWDFSVHGGSTLTDIALGKTLPAGAIITEVVVDYLTAVTGAGAVQANLKVGAATVAAVADLRTAGAPAVAAVAPTVTKLAATSAISLDLNTNAATAGKVRFLISYVLP